MLSDNNPISTPVNKIIYQVSYSLSCLLLKKPEVVNTKLHRMSDHTNQSKHLRSKWWKRKPTKTEDASPAALLTVTKHVSPQLMRVWSPGLPCATCYLTSNNSKKENTAAHYEGQPKLVFCWWGRCLGHWFMHSWLLYVITVSSIIQWGHTPRKSSSGYETWLISRQSPPPRSSPKASDGYFGFLNTSYGTLIKVIIQALPHQPSTET